jgi:hypothetical protein
MPDSGIVKTGARDERLSPSPPFVRDLAGFVRDLAGFSAIWPVERIRLE